LTLREVPETLHQRLCEAAEESRCSLNELILRNLEVLFCSHETDRVDLMERIRQRRNEMKIWIDDGSLEHAIRTTEATDKRHRGACDLREVK